MQLLVQIATGGYDAWKADFDAHSEDLGQAGLTLMQLWRDADDSTKAVALFEAHDRGRAQTWISNQSSLHGGITAQFLRTA
ncbi:MAG: hypothetical protein DI533_14165 [Cereibacter sphaeroides]|uniref:Uncharacterized protein n=1 Tax=Cereibacter sphaeroides TaxID=1063 RepID=A0A2W5S4R3_CERSP|nr:MAG: hypothetical protein DI533_14165 [Cereibacter sphaeroides]